MASGGGRKLDRCDIGNSGIGTVVLTVVAILPLVHCLREDSFEEEARFLSDGGSDILDVDGDWLSDKGLEVLGDNHTSARVAETVNGTRTAITASALSRAARAGTDVSAAAAGAKNRPYRSLDSANVTAVAATTHRQHAHRTITGFCLPDRGGDRSGCRGQCACRWYETCFPKLEPQSGTAASDVGTCSLAIIALVVLSILLFTAVASVVVVVRVWCQYRERAAEIQLRKAGARRIESGDEPEAIGARNSRGANNDCVEDRVQPTVSEAVSTAQKPGIGDGAPAGHKTV